jgi:hypothetical protein
MHRRSRRHGGRQPAAAAASPAAQAGLRLASPPSAFPGLLRPRTVAAPDSDAVMPNAAMLC